eukprot:10478014-Heterocapsa_arctica.AAC.1
MTIKAKADGIINAEDYGAIMKYGPNNKGNILETIMGYSFIAHYFKEDSLTEIIEIATYLENALIKRATEDEEEEQEEYVEPTEKKDTT